MFVVRCSTNFYHRAHTRFWGKKGFELPKKSTARPLILSPQPHGSLVFQTPLHGFLSHNIILLNIVLLLLSGVLGFPRASTTQRRCGQGSFGDRGWQPPRSVYYLLTRITSWSLAFWTSTAIQGSGTIPFNLILTCENIVFISPLFHCFHCFVSYPIAGFYNLQFAHSFALLVVPLGPSFGPPFGGGAFFRTFRAQSRTHQNPKKGNFWREGILWEKGSKHFRIFVAYCPFKRFISDSFPFFYKGLTLWNGNKFCCWMLEVELSLKLCGAKNIPNRL